MRGTKRVVSVAWVVLTGILAPVMSPWALASGTSATSYLGPVCDQGIVVVGMQEAGAVHLFGLDLRTGRLLWDRLHPAIGNVHDLQVVEGMIIGTGDAHGYHAFRLRDGSYAGCMTVNPVANKSVAGGGGRLYVGGYTTASGSSPGVCEVHAFSADGLRPLWTHTLSRDHPILFRLEASHDAVWAWVGWTGGPAAVAARKPSSITGYLVLRGSDGKKLPKRPSPPGSRQPWINLAGGRQLYVREVMPQADALEAVEASSRYAVWCTDTPGQWGFEIADELVIVAQGRSRLGFGPFWARMLSRPPFPSWLRSWAGHQMRTARRDLPKSVVALDGATGALVWRTPLQPEPAVAPWLVVSMVVLVAAAVFIMLFRHRRKGILTG